MPSLDENKQIWRDYDWSEGGEEWSELWGSPDLQWHGSILPRLQAYLPAARVLELAPGFGRWTHYLREHAEHLTLVDLTERCVEACKERFKDAPNMAFHVGDGLTLSMIPDGSLDLVFSFDSLVHVDASVMESYTNELGRVLAPDGVAFLHHSNQADYALYYRVIQNLPRGKHTLRRLGLIEDLGPRRADDMNAAAMRRFAAGAGLRCLSQELFNWNTRRLIDCISVLARQGSSWEGSNKILRNPRFMDEAREIARLAPLYVRRRRAR